MGTVVSNAGIERESPLKRRKKIINQRKIKIFLKQLLLLLLLLMVLSEVIV